MLILLQQMGDVEELPPYANRVIADPSSPPLELYLAAVALLSPTRSMSDAEAKPILQHAVPVLRKALSQYWVLSPEVKAQSPEADAQIAQALGLSLQRLGDLESAIRVYTEALEEKPGDGELLVSRGLALYETERPRALADFIEAVHLRVRAIWPYLLLAWHALQAGVPAEALRLALAAERQPGPTVTRAEVYETIAMALAELGQPQERVLENFDIALALDSKNDRIRKNRELAKAFFLRSRIGRNRQPRNWQDPPVRFETFRRDQSNQINNETQAIYEERFARVSRRLVEA